ncbi:MAG TPA: uracil-DNA glycosylase family protein, partial [Methylomirabilota bacterium]|nr:uracil-DNA glycosylase family protein [Methylomirabilota bacterium]
EVIVCLGVTAARSVLQRRVTISASRGEPLTSPEGYRTLVTIHPSAILRVPDERNREAEEHRFVDDLRRAARIAHHAVRGREEETTR